MTSDSQTTDPGTHRLPTTAIPVHYELTLAPDLVASTFKGHVSITLDVTTATDVLTCNAAELTIQRAWIEFDGGDDLSAIVHTDDTTETVTFTLPRSIATGTIRLRCDFVGILNDKLRGFYRSTYTAEDGEQRVIACTQFEATDARRAFPCWDEPACKATFSISLDVADDLVAISNGPELSRTLLSDGRTARYVFATTMKMSTYLVAFVVGPLESSRTVDVDGIPLRVIARPGQTDLMELALEVGAFALRYFADYYGIVYPGDKMDMVAVPDFAFGAMENLGCVIYRESFLLVDPAEATQAELQAVVDVIAHELAHMWFGDLVTMAWWEGIWLNEAFATFMEMKCTDALRPGWHRWMHFGRERSGALDIDALASTRPIQYPVHSPADAEGMFDVLTYQKGSAVVRMLEQYLGEDRFRAGIHRYLTTHQFGNTETGDLWDALEEETGEPVRAMMDTWIFQGGFPIIDAQRHGSSVSLSQQVFRSLDGDAPGPVWHVPIVARSVAGSNPEVRVLLREMTGAVEVPGDGPVVVNAGGHGFYRVRSDADTHQGLLADLSSLLPLERYSLVDDTVAFVRSGDRPAAALADLIGRLADSGETDLSIWQAAVAGIDLLERAVDDPDVLAPWIQRTLQPMADRLGPEPAPGDDDLRNALRGLVFEVLGASGEPTVLAHLREIVDRAWDDPRLVDADLAAGALRAVARHADERTFEAILGRFRSGDTPQEQFRHLYAAAGVRDPALFARYLELLASTEIRSQNLAFAHRAALQNRDHESVAWAEVRRSWPEIEERLPFNSIHRLVEGVTGFGVEGLARDVQEFFAEHDVPHATKLIAQSMERMRIQVTVRAREHDRLPAALA